MWVIDSLIALFTSSAVALFGKESIERWETSSVMFSTNIVVFTLALLVFLIVERTYPKFSWQSSVVGIITGIAFVFLYKAYSVSPNAGVPTSLRRLQAPLMAIAALFLFGSPITKKDILGHLLVTVGAVMIIFGESKNNNAKTQKKQNTSILVISMAIFVVLYTISLLWQTNITKKTSIHNYMIWSVLSFMTVPYVMDAIKHNDLNPLKYGMDKQLTAEKTNKYDTFYVVLLGIFTYMYLFFQARALKTAPNPGNVKAILSGNIILATLGGIYLFNEPQLSKLGWVGAGTITAGAITVAM